MRGVGGLSVILPRVPRGGEIVKKGLGASRAVSRAVVRARGCAAFFANMWVFESKMESPTKKVGKEFIANVNGGGVWIGELRAIWELNMVVSPPSKNVMGERGDSK